MIIGLVFGGKGIEIKNNLQTRKDIKRVLSRYKIKVIEVDLNSNLESKEINTIDLFFILDSNPVDYKKRVVFFDYLINSGKQFIGQSEKPFLLARDKFRTNYLLSKKWITTPRSKLIKVNTQIDSLPFKFPVVVKDNFGASSEFVEFCRNIHEVNKCLNSFFDKGVKSILIEEYISGIEVTCPYVMLFGRELFILPVQIIYDTPIFDFITKNKTFRNKLQIPPNISPTILRNLKDLCEKANRVINCRYFFRLDIKIEHNKCYVLEINGEPILAKNDYVARSANKFGVSYSELIIGLLANSSKFKNYALINKKLRHFMIRCNKHLDNLMNSVRSY